MKSNKKLFLEHIQKYSILDEKKEYELACVIKKNHNQEAMNTLFMHNLRLVIAIISKKHYQDIDWMDLLQEGCIGLWRAIEKYNPYLGYRFTSYAYIWIDKAINKAIKQQTTKDDIDIDKIAIDSDDINKMIVEEMIESLNAIEQMIIRKRYGINGEKSKTLKEIAKDVKLSYQRIYQIEQIALMHLREQVDKLR